MIGKHRRRQTNDSLAFEDGTPILGDSKDCAHRWIIVEFVFGVYIECELCGVREYGERGDG